SRLKKLRLRCAVVGTLDLIFGALMGAACVLLARRVGTDRRSWRCAGTSGCTAFIKAATIGAGSPVQVMKFFALINGNFDRSGLPTTRATTRFLPSTSKASAVLISANGHSLETELDDTITSTVRADPRAVLIFFAKFSPQPMWAWSRNALRPARVHASKIGCAISA